MASTYHHRLINRIRSILATIFTSYDPFAEKLVENFRQNPFFPFKSIDLLTFEYEFRRWTTISLLIVVQLIVFILTIWFVFHWSSNSKSIWFYVVSIVFVTICFGLNFFENFQRIRIVLSPVNFDVSIYVNKSLKRRYSIDRAFICLHRVASYDVVVYRLVFIIEDFELISISDYFSSKFLLRQIGKRLAENLFIGYLENDESIGIFPKYHRLKSFLIKRQQ